MSTSIGNSVEQDSSVEPMYIITTQQEILHSFAYFELKVEIPNLKIKISLVPSKRNRRRLRAGY